MAFNPFGKSVRDLDQSELQKLQRDHVSEGWHVEYKSGFPPPFKIAHSIASFANTHGGWYIVGIKTDENNEPRSIDGFDPNKHPRSKELLRDAVRSGTDPVPYFESKLVTLSTGKAALVTSIPESYETPHITKDGRIYRRNAEGSDPIHEMDRYTLDKLYERGNTFKEKLKRFCASEFTLEHPQHTQGWLVIYLIPYPLQSLHFLELNNEALRKLREHFATDYTLSKGRLTMGIPFQVMQCSFDSVILRQAESKQLAYITLTAKLFRDGAAKFFIPFQYLTRETIIGSHYASSKTLDELVSRLNDFSQFRILDGFKMFTSFMILTGKYIEFLRTRGVIEPDLLVAYELQGTGRHILFLDSPAFTKQLDDYGVPVCCENGALLPPTLEKNGMMTKIDKEMTSLMHDFGLICEYFGVFRGTLAESLGEGYGEYIVQTSQPRNVTTA
jgi:hypothetical protein